MTTNDIHTTANYLESLSATAQMTYVYKYYASCIKSNGAITSLSALYTASLLPKYIGKDDTFVLYTKNKFNSRYYEWNADTTGICVFDVKPDGKPDGVVHKSEMADYAKERRKPYV